MVFLSRIADCQFNFIIRDLQSEFDVPSFGMFKCVVSQIEQQSLNELFVPRKHYFIAEYALLDGVITDITAFSICMNRNSHNVQTNQVYRLAKPC